MTQITIPAQVVNGHLQHEKSLPELEGQQVDITVVSKEAANGRAPTAPKTQAENADFDPEPPPWLEVEHDFYFPMTRPAIPLGKMKVRKRRGKPCIILPEELPDE